MPISTKPWTLSGVKYSSEATCGHENCQQHKTECTGYDLRSGDVWIASILGEHTLVPLDEITPNALLIAAAPDLLEACKRALDLCERALFNDGAGGTIEHLRKAIAKAEGQ